MAQHRAKMAEFGITIDADCLVFPTEWDVERVHEYQAQLFADGFFNNSDDDLEEDLNGMDFSDEDEDEDEDEDDNNKKKRRKNKWKKFCPKRSRRE